MQVGTEMQDALASFGSGQRAKSDSFDLVGKNDAKVGMTALS